MHRNCGQSPGSRGGGERAGGVLDHLYTPPPGQQTHKPKGSLKINNQPVPGGLRPQQGWKRGMGAGPRRAQTKEAAGSGLGMPTRPHPTPPPKPGNWQGTLDGDPETWLSAAPAWHCPHRAPLLPAGVPGSCLQGKLLGFLCSQAHSLPLETYPRLS